MFQHFTILPFVDSGRTMLQIISGKFFGDGQINERECQAVLFSNYAWLPNDELSSSVFRLQATSYSTSLTPYVLRYTNRYERHSETDILVMPGDTTVIEQSRLLASFYFRAIFSESRAYVEHLTRERPRHSTDSLVPNQFTQRWFDHHVHGNSSEVSGFGSFVDEVVGLQRADFRLFMSCLNMFMDALESVSMNFELAYSMLVYLLEALVSYLDDYQPRWADYDQELKAKLEIEFATIDEASSQRLRTILLSGKQLKLTTRFVSGISSLVGDEFFETESHNVLRAIPKSDLKQTLKNLYSFRSQFVHSLKKLHKQLTIPGMKDADVFVWDHQPGFTLAGLIRLTAHVLQSFVSKRPKVEREDYPQWRSELPGIIQAQMAPKYWIWRSENLKPSHAHKKFNGFFDYIASEIKKRDFVLVLLKELLIEIEKLFESCNREQQYSFFAVYATYGIMIVPEGRPSTTDAFISRHEQSMLEKCSVQMMAALLVLQRDFPWGSVECASCFDAYMQQKYQKQSVNLHRLCEVAIRVEIARMFLRDGENDQFHNWNRAAVLDAAGDESLQQEIASSIDRVSPMTGYQVLAERTGEVSDIETIILWQFEPPLDKIGYGATLRFALDQPFVVRWTTDSWKTERDSCGVFEKEDGTYCVDISAPKNGCSEIELTFFWIGCQKWEGRNFTMALTTSAEAN